MIHKYFALPLFAMLMFGCASADINIENSVKEDAEISSITQASDTIIDLYQGDRLIPDAQIYFDTSSYSIPPKYNETVQTVRQALSHDPYTNIYIHGHADQRGERKYNIELSKKRAESVLQALDIHKETYKRVKLDFFGYDEPKCVSDRIEELRCNRRVDIYLVR